MEHQQGQAHIYFTRIVNQNWQPITKSCIFVGYEHTPRIPSSIISVLPISGVRLTSTSSIPWRYEDNQNMPNKHISNIWKSKIFEVQQDTKAHAITHWKLVIEGLYTNRIEGYRVSKSIFIKLSYLDQECMHWTWDNVNLIKNKGVWEMFH